MPQHDTATIKARAARLREAAATRRTAWLDRQVGSRQRVLIENSDKGHSDGFAPVRVVGAPRGALGFATIVGRDNDLLIGVFE